MAMGPWTGAASSWTGVELPIYPVRGQLLELRVPDPPLNSSIAYQDGYLLRKADGITLAGTTEEHDSGFNSEPTSAGFDAIMDLVERNLKIQASALLSRYLSTTRDYSGLALLPLFVSMRLASILCCLTR